MYILLVIGLRPEHEGKNILSMFLIGIQIKIIVSKQSRNEKRSVWKHVDRIFNENEKRRKEMYADLLMNNSSVETRPCHMKMVKFYYI